jgi:hypothetical protein
MRAIARSKEAKHLKVKNQPRLYPINFSLSMKNIRFKVIG